MRRSRARERGRFRAFLRRVGLIYLNSWRVFRLHWRSLLVAGLLVFTPAAVLEALADFGVDEGLQDSTLEHVLIALAGAGANLLAYQMFKGVATSASMQWRGATGDRSIWHVFLHLQYASLIAADLILTFGTTIGLLLLLVPGILFATWFGLTPVVIEMEDLRVWPAMKRSYALVRGNFIVALTLMLVTYVVVYGVEEAIQQAIHSSLDGVWDQEIFNGAVAALVASILFKPISALATVELTQQLVESEKSLGRGAHSS